MTGRVTLGHRRRGADGVTMVTRRTVLATAAALAALPARSEPVTPLRVVGDRLYLPAVVDGVVVEALLDSAAETSIVDAAFAARLALRGGEAVTARGTGAATAAGTLVKGVTIDVAGLRLRPPAVAVIDLGDVARRLGRGPLAVVLGRELFDAGRLAIDIDAATLAVVPRSATPPGVRLPLTARRGIETVPVTIEGRDGHADFDLGNGGTVLIGAAFAARHGLPGDRTTGVIPGGGIGGGTTQTTFTLGSFAIAGTRFSDLPVAIDASPTASDANVGVRLLRRFAVTTDFAARSVWLEYRG